MLAKEFEASDSAVRVALNVERMVAAAVVPPNEVSRLMAVVLNPPVSVAEVRPPRVLSKNVPVSAEMSVVFSVVAGRPLAPISGSVTEVPLAKFSVRTRFVNVTSLAIE